MSNIQNKDDAFIDELFETVADEVREVLKRFNFKSVQYGIKSFDNYTDLECPVVAIEPRGIMPFQEKGIDKSMTEFTFSIFIIYHTKSKLVKDIYKSSFALYKHFNGLEGTTNDGAYISAVADGSVFASTLKYKEQRVTETSIKVSVVA